MSKKKLQTYYGTVAYKADKTAVKRAFHGRSKADAKAKYFAYIAEHGQAEKCSDLYTVSGWAAYYCEQCHCLQNLSSAGCYLL